MGDATLTNAACSQRDGATGTRSFARSRGDIELLAPAGSLDALFAAVAAGADAVYTGLGMFNARAANAGLTLEELERGCRLAHAHGVRVYVTLNVCMYDDELAPAVDLARRALACGADALIVADAGLALRLRAAMPGVELHLSTQAGAQSPRAVRLAARELGVERVTCARELSVDELLDLCETGTHIEAFCHGAICVCYSGACSYSALLRGRSANRGDCAQPCRLAYELQDAEGRVLAGGAWNRERPALPAGAEEGDRLLCPRDYLGIRHVGEMVRAGVHAFKIEGRMKGPDYVYNVVGCYRVALDAAREGRELASAELEALEAQLARSFSRGFTDGYLRGGHARTGAALMSAERAINQGLLVGRVAECRHEEVVIAFERAVGEGDMIEIRSTPGSDAPSDVPKRWPIVPCPAQVPAGARMVVHCKRRVECGSAVHLVRSVSVIEAARAAVELIREEERTLSSGRALLSAPGAADVVTARSERSVRPDGLGRERTAGFADARDAGRAANEPRCGKDSIASAPAKDGCRSALDLGEVCRNSDEPAVRRACERVLRGEAPAVICRNLAQVSIVREMGAAWEVAAPVNVWNAETARWLLALGARRVWLPEELGEERAQCLCSELGETAAARIGRPVPHATPLMVMEHCILTSEGPCSGECPTCSRRIAASNGERFLLELDRKSTGTRLPVRVDELGRTRIYHPECNLS